MNRPEIGFKATTGALIVHCSRQFGAQEFVVTDESRMTYAQAEVASRNLSRRLLAAGIGKGTRVGAQFPYSTDWIVTWLAVTRIGAVFLPLSTAYKPGELGRVLRIADIHTLIVPQSMFGESRSVFLEEAVSGLAECADTQLRLPATPFLRSIWVLGFSDRRWATLVTVDGDGEADRNKLVSEELFAEAEAEVTPADLMIGIHTSGTTSDPKGVLHTHGALVRHGANLAKVLDWTESDRVFCGMPFFWVGGIAYTVLPVMHVGGRLLCIDRFEAGRALDFMEREQATIITGWPGVTGPILNHPSRASRKIPGLTHPRFAPGVPALHKSLGMTETCGPHTGPGPEDLDRPVPPVPPGSMSMGPSIPFIEHRIADPETGAVLAEGVEGAILVRGYSLMAGMIKREREDVFTPDGWYNTGDKGFLQDGLLFLSGRLSEMIKTSGNNVAPAEVEGVLLKLPSVKEAYVAGIPDAERGEIVAAALVPHTGTKIDPEAIREAVRERLSNYKVPRKILVLARDEVPWLASGKVDRLTLKKMLNG